MVVEDFDTGEVRTTDRGGPHHELIARMATAFNPLLAERGGASDFAADAWRHLRQRGLVNTGASGHVVFDIGGEGFAQVTAANARQVHDGLLSLGISAEDIEHFIEVLSDPDTIIGTPVLVTASGTTRDLTIIGRARNHADAGRKLRRPQSREFTSARRRITAQAAREIISSPVRGHFDRLGRFQLARRVRGVTHRPAHQSGRRVDTFSFGPLKEGD